MKQRCLLLLSLFLATLTGAWAQLPTLGTVTGTGVNTCGPNSNDRNLTIAFSTSTQSIAGFYYRLSATGDGGFADTDNLSPFPSAAAGDVFNNATTSLTFDNFSPTVNGAANVVITLQSSPDNVNWTNVGSPTASFNVGVTPANIPAFNVNATPSVPNPVDITISANSLAASLPGSSTLITNVCSSTPSALTFNVTATDCQGTQQRQWAFNTTGTAPASADPSWSATIPTTQPNDGQVYYYWSRCVNLSPLCPGPATSGTRSAARVRIDITPIATAPTLNPSTICAGYAPVAFDGSGGCPGGTTTQWWREDPGAPGTFDRLSSLPATTGVAYGPAGNESKYPALNTLSEPLVPMTVTFYASCIDNNGAFCESPRQAVVLTIKPTPGFPVALAAQTTNICSGTPLNYTITGAAAGTFPTGTVYAWAAPAVTGGVTGGTARTAPGTGDPLTDNLVNPTNINQTAIYSVTASADGCSLDPNSKFTITVTVKPTPAITAMTTTICGRTVIGPLVNTGDFTVTPVNGTNGIVPASIRYDWAAPVAPGITGLAAGVNQPNINGQLTNTTNAPIDVVYTVTPTYTGGPGADCPGATFTVTVTVNPTPGVDQIQNRNICSGETFQLAPIQGYNITPANTQYSWPLPVAPGINGLAAGTNESTVSGTLTNTTNATIQVNYVVSQTAYGCVGNNFNVLVDVKPVPKIAAKTVTVCSLSPATLTLTNTLPDIVPVAAQMEYFITRTDANANVTTSLVLPSTQTQPAGNTISFGTLTNLTNVQQIVTFEVTPTYIGGPGANCPGTPFTVTITVNPTPVIANKTASVCSESSVTVTPVNNQPTEIVPAGTTYTWTVVDNPNVTGDINQPAPQPNFTTGVLTNSTTMAQVVVYTVTPTAGTCVGSTFTVTVTVNPKPVLSITAGSPNPGTICVAQSTTLSFDIAGAIGPNYIVTFSQTGGTGTALPPTILPSPLTGTGSSFSFIATPPSGAVGPITYTIQTVEYTANGITCTYTPPAGTVSQTFNVHPQPTAPVGSGGPIKIVGPDNKSEACEATGIVNVTNNATCLGANEVPKWYTNQQHLDALATVPPASPFGPTSGLASPPNTINTATGANNGGFISPGTITYWVACLDQVTGCETPAVNHVSVTFTINPMGATPTGGFNPSTVCQTLPGPGATTTVTSAVNCSGQAQKWYDALTGGNVVAATSMTPPTFTFKTDILTPQTLYVVCVTDKGCETVPRTPVSFQVTPAPADPTPMTSTFSPASACQGVNPIAPATVAVTDMIDCGANTERWYEANGTTLLSFAGNGNVPGAAPTSLSTLAHGTQTYKVSCIGAGPLNCESLNKATITFVVHKAPDAPVPFMLTKLGDTKNVVCNGTTGTLTNNATCKAGEVTVWYADNTTPTSMGSAPTMVPSSTTTYYVACRNEITGCESLTRTASTIHVLKPQAGVIAASQSICSGDDPAAFTSTTNGSDADAANNPGGMISYRWEQSVSPGAPGSWSSIGGATGATYDEGVLTNNTNMNLNYHYRRITIVTLNGVSCESAPTAAITITVKPIPTVADIPSQVICSGTTNSAVTFMSGNGVAGTTYKYTVAYSGASMGTPFANTDPATGVPSLTLTNASNSALAIVTITVTPTANGCTGPAKSFTITVMPTPATNLQASQTDVCPNTEITLNPNCSTIYPGSPFTTTVQWSSSDATSPAGPTVTPNAPDQTYTYTAKCIATYMGNTCEGNSSSVVVRTYRLLVDIVKVAHPGGNVNQPGAIMEVQNDLGKDLSVPKNTIVSNDGMTPRTWNILARPCYAPVGSISFEFLAGPLPLSYKTVDNFAPHAFFANDGASTFYSQASMTYGPGSMMPFYTGGTPNFPNGIYTVLVQGRTNAVPGAIPAARNKLSGGALLSTRTVTFEVKGTNSGARIGVEEEVVDAENWLSLVQNPISEEIMIRISGNVGDNVQLNLSNLQGQEVHKSNLQLETTSQLNKINARDFSTGFYILKAVNGDKVKTIKVLKVQ